MELEQFTAKPVTPGEPITAQAWNELVTGLQDLNQFVLTTQATSLRATLTNTVIDLSSVRITVQRDDGWLSEAVAPVDANGEFVFASLPPGTFTIEASAPGFNSVSTNVTVPTAEVVSMTLEQSGAFMPNLIGVELADALKLLQEDSITVGRLLDVVGREIPPAKPDAVYATQPVLMQLPDPGTPVPPEGKVQIVVSAALQVDDSVEMPPLTGLTLTEARKTLESLGLKLGKVETRQNDDE
jgi:hypothetical protein